MSGAAEKTIPMEILELKQETPSFFDLKLVPVLDQHLTFQAGQYVAITVPNGRKGYFAIASEPEEKSFVQFLIKRHDEGAAAELLTLKKGNQVRVSLPHGTAYSVERMKGRNLILIGIGSALAPLRSMARSILRRDQFFGKIIFLYGAKSIDEIPYWEDFELWKNKFDLKLAVSQLGASDERAIQGRVHQLLSELSLGPDFSACVCGSRSMEEEVTKLLETRGVLKENIFLNY